MILKNITNIWECLVYYSNTSSRLKGNVTNIITDNIDALKLDKYGNINSDNDTIYHDNDVTIAWAGSCNWSIMHHDTIFNREYLISNLEEASKNNKKIHGNMNGIIRIVIIKEVLK